LLRLEPDAKDVTPVLPAMVRHADPEIAAPSME
jgi:hypothetical protein